MTDQWWRGKLVTYGPMGGEDLGIGVALSSRRGSEGTHTGTFEEVTVLWANGTIFETADYYLQVLDPGDDVE